MFAPLVNAMGDVIRGGGCFLSNGGVVGDLSFLSSNLLGIPTHHAHGDVGTKGWAALASIGVLSVEAKVPRWPLLIRM